MLPNPSSGPVTPPSSITRHCDVAILGGSAAGLSAALQLARQQRSVLVIDDDTPRNAPAEHLHGYLGREGAPPAQLRAIGREEVRGYGGEVLPGRVLSVERGDAGFQLELSGGHRVIARRVLAATGIVDEMPDIDGLAERWGKTVIHCPFCHGYEVRDRRVVQIVTTPMGIHPARLMRHLTDDLTIVIHDTTGVDADTIDALSSCGVPVITAHVERVIEDAAAPLAVQLSDGRSLPADAVMLGTTFHPRTEAVSDLGVATASHPTGLGEVIAIAPSGLTNIEGVYAAGNITDPGMQVIAAAAHGGFVGAQIAFDLASEDLAKNARVSAVQEEWNHRYAASERIWSGGANGVLVAEAGMLRPGRALDVGAGEGADAIWLAEHGWQVTASDISDIALARIDHEARQRDLAVRTTRCDANDLAPFGDGSFDLVSLHYGSFHRTADGRGLRNLLNAVAEGGTLLVVGHDHSAHPLVDPAADTRMFDARAYVGVDEVLAALSDLPDWRIDVHEIRPRPAGAATAHHAPDVVLRATRLPDTAEATGAHHAGRADA